MPIAKGSNAISKPAVYSEVKQRSASPRPHRPVSGNATGKNRKDFVKKKAGISLFLVQRIDGNKV
jgi:hypothetical protein